MWSVEGKVDQQKRKGVCGGGRGGAYHLQVVEWTDPVWNILDCWKLLIFLTFPKPV